MAFLWIAATCAVIALFLIYATFLKNFKEEGGGGGNLPPTFLAPCDQVANGTYNPAAFPKPHPLVLCEGGPTPLRVHTFGNDVVNVSKANGSWLRLKEMVMINALIEFEATFDSSGTSFGFATLLTPVNVNAVHHRGSGTVEVVSGSGGFWLCPVQVISEGTFMASTYRCDKTGILNQRKIVTLSFIIMLQAVA